MKYLDFLKIAGKVVAARSKFARAGWLITMLMAGALVIFLSGQSRADAPAINVPVETGQSQVLTVGSDIREAAISNTDIADIRVMTPRKLLIIGKNPGNTNLILWDAADQTTFFNLDVAFHQHQQIVLQVKVAEVGRSALRDLGINFSSIGNEWRGASYAGGSFSPPAGSAMAPGLTLSSDVTAALVRIPLPALAEPGRRTLRIRLLGTGQLSYQLARFHHRQSPSPRGKQPGIALFASLDRASVRLASWPIEIAGRHKTREVVRRTQEPRLIAA